MAGKSRRRTGRYGAENRTVGIVASRRRALAATAVLLLAIAITGCGPAPPSCISPGTLSPPSPANAEQPIEKTSPDIAGLAREYQPTVVMSEFDRFWPVSVATVLRERDAVGARVRLISGGRPVADPPQLMDLKPSPDFSAYLDFPAVLGNKTAQMRTFLRGLAVPESRIAAWPTDLSDVATKSAQIYFYDAGTRCSYGGQTTSGYRALQYWFFYGLNYYPMTVDTPTMLTTPLRADSADVDFHEGDWEHITVLLGRDASGYTPQYVWMARHATEGVLIPWDRVQHDGGTHPVIYPAFGGHPSYPDCGAHGRALLAASVYDYVVCTGTLYTLHASRTPLVDLAHVSWSCWPGYFGTTAGTNQSSNADDPTGQILVAGPRSPLLQAENGGICPDNHRLKK